MYPTTRCQPVTRKCRLSLRESDSLRQAKSDQRGHFGIAAICLVLGLLLPVGRQALGQAAPDTVIAPFLDDQTLVVARLDLRKFSPSAIAEAARNFVPGNPAVASHAKEFETHSTEAIRRLAATGIHELYAVMSLADVGPKRVPLFVVAPLDANAEPQRVLESLKSVLHFESGFTRPGAVVVGPEAAVERLKDLQRPAPRQEFARGLAAAGDAPIKLVFAAGDDTRRVIREMLPRLPDEVGGGSGKMLADGLVWAVLSIQPPPQLELNLLIQSKDADAAVALRGMVMSALQFAGQDKSVRRHVPEFDSLVRLLTPQLAGDKLVVTIGGQRGSVEEFIKLLGGPIEAARAVSGRQQSFNNLKQIGLAMHNFHGTYDRFPPQAIRDKNGKALLSWRVAILPYIESLQLYKEFHLDEPWDSEHNRQLIAKMPAVFASPQLSPEQRKQGLTSYLVPLSQAPPAIAKVEPDDPKKPVEHGKNQMIFDLVAGSRIQQIIDGTSNTILAVETNPKIAVPWTKPDDLVIDAQDPLKDLRGQADDGFCGLFADGHVQFIKLTINPKTLMLLLQMNDGQPIGEQ
jgi:hypothetical protein